MVEVSRSKNAPAGAFNPPEQRGGAHRVQSAEAMAIEDNLTGPTKVPDFCFHLVFIF